MIKVKSFHDILISSIDEELEDFIADREIKRENIITIKFYASKNHEDDIVYHYARIVYEIGK